MDRSDIIGWIIGIAVAGALMAVVLVKSCSMTKDHEAWAQERVALDASIARWTALIEVDECLRYGESLSTKVANGEGLAVASCVDQLAPLATDPAFAGDARAALAAWTDAEHAAGATAAQLSAYRDGDWREDDNASLPRRVAAMREAHERRSSAIARARAAIVPVVEREVEIVQHGYELRAARDEVWWRIELAARYDRLLDDVARARREHRDFAAVMKAGARDLAAAARDAPREVRHQLNTNTPLFDGNAGRNARNDLWPHPSLATPAPFAPLREEPDLPSDTN